MRPTRPSHLLALSGATVLAFSAVARAVARRAVRAEDAGVRETVQHARGPATDAAAEVAGPLGKEWLHFPVALALGAYLWRRGARRAAFVAPLASATSEIAARLFDRTLVIQRAPPGHPTPNKPSFPSGHAMETSAVTLTSAYVLAREDVVTPSRAFAIACALSLTSALGRLELDRHWVSDAVGGALAGVAIASACAAVYEAAADAPPGERRPTLR